MIGIGGVITIHGISIVPSHQSWRFPEPGGARNEAKAISWEKKKNEMVDVRFHGI